MQRFDYTTSSEERIESMVVQEHFLHVKNYLLAPIEEKYMHYTKALRAWKRLVDMGATSEARELSVNFAINLELIKGRGRADIPR